MDISIAKLLSTNGYIQVNKELIKLFGLHEAILIGELCSEYIYYEKQNMLEDGMFYSTRANIEENTGLNEHFQRKAFETLTQAGIVEISKRGMPAKNYYRINYDKLLISLSTSPSRDEEQVLHEMHLNNNKQINIKNERKNSKEFLQEFSFGKSKPKKDNLFTKCVTIIDSYDFSSQSDIRSLLIQYLNYRLQIKDKPLYANMWKGMLNKLANMCDNDVELYEQVIQQSIERGYLSFYPVTSYSKSSSVRESIEHLTSSEVMTDEDYMRLDRLTEERKKNGLRTEF